jgi:leader peptidase (prepilin peptidase)/N-methyltransferase
MDEPLTYHDIFYLSRGVCLALSIILGSMIGSFLNVVVWRLPRGMSLSVPPSHCPKCGHRIRWYENIPVISWLCLRARCSSCHLPISWRYPAGELAVGFLFGGIYLHISGNGWPVGVCFAWLWLAGLLLAGALIDLDFRVIPDKLNFFGMGVALLLAIAWPESRLAVVCPEEPQAGGFLLTEILSHLPRLSLRLSAVVDCVLGGLVGWLLTGGIVLVSRLLGGKTRPSPLGGGDVKFLTMTGMFLGADACVFILLGAAALGFMYGVLRRLAGRGQGNRNVVRDICLGEVPFGPFLAFFGLFWCVFGNWFYLLFCLTQRKLP